MEEQITVEPQRSNIALQSEFENLQPNAPIPIYSGLLRIPEASLEGQGTVEFAFLPSPSIRFHLDRSVFPAPHEITLEIPGLQSSAKGHRLRTDSEGTFGKLNMSAIEYGAHERIGRVEFHLVNFRDYIGQSVCRRKDGLLNIRTARTSFEMGNWTVVIEILPTFKERWKEAVDTHGYAVTHIGVMRRTDNELFAPKDATKALECLYWFLSFVNGARCSYIFPTGFRHGGILWREMTAVLAAPAEHNQSWLAELAPGACLAAAGGFHHCWQDATGRDWLLHAVSLYLASNRNVSGTDVCLATSQITLELLSWIALVEQNQIVSKDGFENLSAADKIRLLLFWCGVSPVLPSALNDLRAGFPTRSGAVPDGPMATTEVRNAIIHPTKTLRAKLHSFSDLAKYEAWQLNMLYIERAMLRLIGYFGPFHSRLTHQAESITPPVR
jgi:hypothetical protein